MSRRRRTAPAPWKSRAYGLFRKVSSCRTVSGGHNSSTVSASRSQLWLSPASCGCMVRSVSRSRMTGMPAAAIALPRPRDSAGRLAIVQPSSHSHWTSGLVDRRSGAASACASSEMSMLALRPWLPARRILGRSRRLHPGASGAQAYVQAAGMEMGSRGAMPRTPSQRVAPSESCHNEVQIAKSSGEPGRFRLTLPPKVWRWREREDRRRCCR